MSSIAFDKPWGLFRSSEGPPVRRPMLDVFLRINGNLWKRTFLVDSGADTSLASRKVADALTLDWQSGGKRILGGISRREECQVECRVHAIEVMIPEAALQIAIPVCFAEGDAPLVLGREGFFEYFRITFDRPALTTTFEFVGEVG